MIVANHLELRGEGAGIVQRLGRLGDRLVPRLAAAWSTLVERWRGAARAEPLTRAIAVQDVQAAEELATAPILATAPDELVRIQRRLFGSVAEHEAFVEAGGLTGRASSVLRPHVELLRPALREASVRWLAGQEAPFLIDTATATRELGRHIVADGIASDRSPARLAASGHGPDVTAAVGRAPLSDPIQRPRLEGAHAGTSGSAPPSSRRRSIAPAPTTSSRRLTGPRGSSPRPPP